MDENNDIQKNIEALNQQKAALEAEINQKTATVKQLSVDITTHTTTRDGLNADIVNLTATRNSLNNEIATNTSTRDNLNSEIVTLTNSKSELESHLAGTTSSKQTLEAEITQRSATITQLDADIAARTATRSNLNTEITTLTVTQTELSNSIATNTPIKQALDKEVAALTSNKNLLTEENKKLQSDKQKWEENVKQWREKYDLYSNDIAGISEDNLAQRTKYGWGIGLSFLATILCMILLITSIKDGIEIPDGIKKDLQGNPRLLFLVYILMRISIVGSLFVVIFVFLNLARGFVSQFIKTQEKMSAVRLIDYLVSKIGKETKTLTDAEKIPFETAKLNKQNEILNKHLPTLIEYNPSSFDKLSKTKSPDEALQELIKAGKLVAQK